MIGWLAAAFLWILGIFPLQEMLSSQMEDDLALGEQDDFTEWALGNPRRAYWLCWFLAVIWPVMTVIIMIDEAMTILGRYIVGR